MSVIMGIPIVNAPNEQFIRPHRLCQGLDRGPEPRCPDRGTQGRRMHHDPHRDPRRRHPNGSSELGVILDFIHPDEMLVVTRIDRLARSMHDLQVIVATLNDKGAHLAATEQSVDTSTAAGKAFFDMLGVFAEFETNLRR